MNMKKKLTAIISGVLCLALLMALPFGFSGLADPDTGLNGDSGAWSEFDQSIYDVTVSSSSFKSSNFEWPSSGSVLVRASGTNWSASDFSGITVPAGIVLDIYQYAGGSTDSYKLLVHVDTTDGTPETIGSSSSNWYFQQFRHCKPSFAGSQQLRKLQQLQHFQQGLGRSRKGLRARNPVRKLRHLLHRCSQHNVGLSSHHDNDRRWASRWLR